MLIVLFRDFVLPLGASQSEKRRGGRAEMAAVEFRCTRTYGSVDQPPPKRKKEFRERSYLHTRT